MTDALQDIAARMYLAGVMRGMVMGFCLGAIIVWSFK